MVKVYFRNFTFKKPEDEKDCFKKEKPGSLAEGNSQKGTPRRELQEGTPNRKLIFTDVRTCRKQDN